MKKPNAWLALLLALGLIAASCGSDSDDDTEAGGSSDSAEDSDGSDDSDDAMDDSDDAMEDGDHSMPGAGVAVTMGKADWTTEDPNAYVIHNLMEELGYDVTDPADLELGPSNAYLAMAQGDMDFWINSWYPGHNSWLEAELPDGSKVGDAVSVTGEMMMAGGLQGYLITKSFAEEYGITSLDDFNSNAEAIAAYDAQDPQPDNGVADIYGCQESWTCDDIIESQIAFSGWENIQQSIAGYDAMFADFLGKVNNDEPAIMYTWAPTQYLAQAIPGQNVMWLSQEAVLDDSNPLGIEGGEEYAQGEGFTALGEDTCTQGPSGCQTGWVGADIEVTANKAWLEDNPAARALFEVFNPPIIDVAIMDQQRAATDGAQADIETIAANWIAANRDLVDGWLEVARAAG